MTTSSDVLQSVELLMEAEVETHLELAPLRDCTVWNAVHAALARRRRQDGNAGTPWQHCSSTPSSRRCREA